MRCLLAHASFILSVLVSIVQFHVHVINLIGYWLVSVYGCAHNALLHNLISWVVSM